MPNRSKHRTLWKDDQLRGARSRANTRARTHTHTHTHIYIYIYIYIYIHTHTYTNKQTNTHKMCRVVSKPADSQMMLLDTILWNEGYYLTKVYSSHLRTQQPSVTTVKTSSTVKLVSFHARCAPTFFLLEWGCWRWVCIHFIFWSWKLCYKNHVISFTVT